MLRIINYKIASPKLPIDFNGFRIIHLSDLHGAVYGENQNVLLNAIRKANPTIVVMTGDMAENRKNAIDKVTFLCKKLCKHYPVYYSIGNHEQTLPDDQHHYLMKTLSLMGVTILDNTHYSIERQNSQISLYGLSIPYIYYHDLLREHKRGAYFSKEDANHILGTPPSDHYCILLAHNPIYFPSYQEWGADLTLCGHMHGGIIRIPGLRGVFSPDRKLFPKYDWGHFEKQGSHMIVSAGLGNHFLTRIMNPPEIGVITLSSNIK